MKLSSKTHMRIFKEMNDRELDNYKNMSCEEKDSFLSLRAEKMKIAAKQRDLVSRLLNSSGENPEEFMKIVSELKQLA